MIDWKVANVDRFNCKTRNLFISPTTRHDGYWTTNQTGEMDITLIKPHGTELVVVSTRRWQYDVIRQLCHLHAHELNYFPAMTRIVTAILSIGTAVHCLLYNFQCNGQNRNYTVMRHQNYLEGYGCVMVGCSDV